MNIESVRLINFRNYDNFNIELNKKMNIFIGKNAQGKTNLLESFYTCATGRSFRTNRDREMINWDKEEAYIATEIHINGMKRLIEIKIEKDKSKRIRINKIELKNLKELDSGLNVVLFSPDDLKLVKEGPGERRSFLDTSISQIKPVYRYNLNRYNKILSQSNNLLKSNKKKEDIIKLLDIFDLQLGKIGTEIIVYRIKFLEKLSLIAKKIHKELTLGDEELTLDYISNISFDQVNKDFIEKDFLKKLKIQRDKDLFLGNTGVGPHRDDIKININAMDARTYGSQGQQRTIVLSMKLSEVEIIKMDKGSYPVILLDDVFSELDEDRRKHLSVLFKDMQTVITSTDIIDLNEFDQIDKSIFYIEDGKLLLMEE